MRLENISMRFDTKTLERLENLMDFVAETVTAKANSTRADVIRAAILIGVERLEKKMEKAEAKPVKRPRIQSNKSPKTVMKSKGSR
jgi:hypothetical protein